MTIGSKHNSTQDRIELEAAADEQGDQKKTGEQTRNNIRDDAHNLFLRGQQEADNQGHDCQNKE